jgi:hypothetical protein
MKGKMKPAPNKSLERPVTRLHALTGGILVPAAQRLMFARNKIPIKLPRCKKYN